MPELALFIPILAVLLIFGIPIIAILTSHMRNMAQMKLDAQQKGDARLLAEIEQLRKEFASLRDTATQYDLSFDTALQRVEGRLGSIESRVGALEQGENLSAGNRAS